MHELEPDQLGRAIRVDTIIHLATLLGLVASIVGGTYAVTNIQAQNDKRLALLEAAQQQQHVVDSAQDQNVADQIQLIRASQTRIENKLDRLIENQTKRYETRP